MAAKGTIAKQNVIEKLKEAFGTNFITSEGSKAYVWAYDGPGEKVQIALSLTCPKNLVGAAGSTSGEPEMIDFEAMSAIGQPAPPQITKTEEDNIKELMAKLGL